MEKKIINNNKTTTSRNNKSFLCKFNRVIFFHEYLLENLFITLFKNNSSTNTQEK